MNKRESKSSITFRHWLASKFSKDFETSALEMKDSRGKDSISLTEIKERQTNYGRAIMESEKGVLIRTLGGNGEPDYIFLKHENAFTVIKFPDCFCIINTRLLGNEKVMSAKKTFSSKRARELADIVIDL